MAAVLFKKDETACRPTIKLSSNEDDGENDINYVLVNQRMRSKSCINEWHLYILMPTCFLQSSIPLHCGFPHIQQPRQRDSLHQSGSSVHRKCLHKTTSFYEDLCQKTQMAILPS